MKNGRTRMGRRKTKKTKRGNKKRFVNHSSVDLLSGKYMFADRVMCKPEYSQQYRMTNIQANNWGIKQIQINPYDLEVATEPAYSAKYHSIMSSIYKYYRVYGAKITITAQQINGTSQQSTYGLGYFWSQDKLGSDYPAPSSFAPDDYPMLPYGAYKQGTAFTSNVTLTTYMAVNKLYGLTKKAIQTDFTDFVASTPNNIPNNQIYLTIGIRNLWSAGAVDFQYSIKVKLYVEYFDRKITAAKLAPEGGYTDSSGVTGPSGPNNGTGDYGGTGAIY